MRVDLPGGQWAELLDPDQLRSGDTKAYVSAIPVGGVGMTVGDVDAMKDVLLRRVVTSWSIDLPLPKDLPGTPAEAGSLDRITIPQYRALSEAIQPHIDLINADGEPDPKSSPASAGTSKDRPSSSNQSSET